MKKICIKCGAEFETSKNYPDKTLCDDCAAESIHSVVRERVCVDCGSHFMGYPRSMRCEKCNIIHKQELDKIYKARAKAGKTRLLGSIDHCEKCGKEYIVKSGMQRYCPDCAPEAMRENDRPKSREWNRVNRINEVRMKDRKNSIAEIPCAFCGKMFIPRGKINTCSKECATALSKSKHNQYVKDHREELNAYGKKWLNNKLSAMSEEEREEYRRKVNEKARENYRKRKERKNQNKSDY